MAEAHNRRNLRRFAWTLVVLISLPLGYVGSAATLYVLNGAGMLPANVQRIASVYVTPLRWYGGSGLPGGRFVAILMGRAEQLGFRWRS